MVSTALYEAARDTARDYSDGDVAGEEDFTGQMIGAMKASVRGTKTKRSSWQTSSLSDLDDLLPATRVRLSARQLVSKGQDAEESWSGADLVVALDVRAQQYNLQKGFIAQAKLLEPGKQMIRAEWDRLKDQCNKMVSVTSASYVFLYSHQGVFVLSASVVQGATDRRLHRYIGIEPPWIFYDFLVCHVGDPRLKATSKSSLKTLRRSLGVQHALLIKASDDKTLPLD